MLQNGALPVPYSAKYPKRCLTMHLAAAAKEFDRYTNESLIAKKLQSLFSVTELNNKVRRGWVFPELAECRRLWELRNGGSWPWHYVEDEPGVPAKWRTFGD